MLSFVDGSNCYLRLYFKKIFFAISFYIHKKKKRHPFYVRSISFKAQTPRDLLSNKNGILHFFKVNNSIAIKLLVNLLNNR